MINNSQAPFEAYLDHLRELPFVLSAEVSQVDGPRGETRWRLTLDTPHGPEVLRPVLLERRDQGELSRVLDVEQVLSARDPRPLLLFLSGDFPEVRDRLRRDGVFFADRWGNCSLDLGGRYVAEIERPAVAPRLPTRPVELRGASYRVLFALLVCPAMVVEPLRTIGTAAGVSTTAVTDMVGRLQDEGQISLRKGSRVFRPTRALVERWLVGYRDLVRPRLVVGRFALPQDREYMLARVLDAALGSGWAWGGGRADRLLGGLYSAPEITLHLNITRHTEQAGFPLRPDPGGVVEVLGVPGPIAWPATAGDGVHPLLVYSELRIARDRRAWEAAEALAERQRLFVEEA